MRGLGQLSGPCSCSGSGVYPGQRKGRPWWSFLLGLIPSAGNFNLQLEKRAEMSYVSTLSTRTQWGIRPVWVSSGTTVAVSSGVLWPGKVFGDLHSLSFMIICYVWVYMLYYSFVCVFFPPLHVLLQVYFPLGIKNPPVCLPECCHLTQASRFCTTSTAAAHWRSVEIEVKNNSRSVGAESSAAKAKRRSAPELTIDSTCIVRS